MVFSLIILQGGIHVAVWLLGFIIIYENLAGFAI